MAARSFLVNFFGGNKSPASSEEEKHNQALVSIPTHTGTNRADGKNPGAILIRKEIVDSRNPPLRVPVFIEIDCGRQAGSGNLVFRGLAAGLGIATDTLEPTRAAAFAWSQDALGHSRA